MTKVAEGMSPELLNQIAPQGSFTNEP